MSRSRIGQATRTLLALALTFAAAESPADTLLTNARAVDVTPSGFSVVWEASEPADPGLVVYSDEAGSNDITTQFEITAFPLRGGDPLATDVVEQTAAAAALRGASRAAGLMRIQVEGAAPSTTYYFRVSAQAGEETTLFPSENPLPVTTPAANSFVAGSHQLLVSFGSPDSPGSGWVVTAETEETTYPVSAVVGDGAASHEAFLNLGQLFSLDGSNWQPTGSKLVTIEVRKGGDSGASPSFDLVFSSDFVVGMAYLIDFESGLAPLITLLDPAVDQYTIGEGILISWVDTLPSGDANIALYYDTDATGEDGSLIAADLEAEPDGNSDTYIWDTESVSDGSYFVYALISNEQHERTSYATGKVTIDRNFSDSDSDQMSDLWEVFYFGSLASSGNEDTDSDGSNEADEFSNLTNPNVPDVRLQLIPGINFVAFPVSFSPPMNSEQLLESLGGAARSISRIDTLTETVETTTWEGGAAGGSVFSIVSSEGYYLQLDEAYDAVLDGSAENPNMNFSAGINLVGFPQLPAGYEADDLLEALGGPAAVSSISRFNPDSGRFESRGYEGDTPSGTNFPIKRGVSYLISAKATISGLSQ